MKIHPFYCILHFLTKKIKPLYPDVWTTKLYKGFASCLSINQMLAFQVQTFLYQMKPCMSMLNVTYAYFYICTSAQVFIWHLIHLTMKAMYFVCNFTLELPTHYLNQFLLILFCFNLWVFDSHGNQRMLRIINRDYEMSSEFVPVRLYPRTELWLIPHHQLLTFPNFIKSMTLKKWFLSYPLGLACNNARVPANWKIRGTEIK